MKSGIHFKKGFTLIELLVVIAIIGVLSAVVLASLNSARAKGRDALRKSDLIEVQKALEVYYNDNGSYPVVAAWSGISPNGGSKGVTGAGGYIPNLAPQYIGSLPVDPSGNFSGWNGFLYFSDGTHYKLLDFGDVETIPGSADFFYDPARPNFNVWKVCDDISTAGCQTW
jgi:prepilin-type N-terminal cleavage/methylation domain-containing protein